MSTEPGGNLAAAHELLATLSAGRAALLQLAGNHLPFDRVLALHRLLPPPEPASGGWDGAAALRDRVAREMPARPAAPPAEAPRPAKARARSEEPPRPKRAEVEPPKAAEAKPSSSRRGPEARSAPVESPVRVPEPEAPVSAPVPVAVSEAVSAPEVEPVTVSAPEVEPVTESVNEPDETVEPAVLESVPSEPAALAEEPTAEPAESFAEPDTQDAPAAPADGPLLVNEHGAAPFSGSGENTANWGVKSEISLGALLAVAPGPDSDTTQIVAGPILAVSSELSDWAADVLGAPSGASTPPVSSEPTGENLPDASVTPLASEPTAGEMAAPKVVPTADEDRPMLREPRVMGAAVASLDVRAAAKGVAPRLAGADEIEVAAEDGDFDDAEEAESEEGGGFQVTFEQSVAIRTRPRAPRLTDDEPGEQTQPGVPIEPPVSSIVVDDKQITSLLAEAKAFASKGELPKAIQAFTDALDMRPSLTEAHIGRGRCHLELGDYSSAMSDFARAEDLAPDKPEAHVATGDLYFARKEYKRAIEFYDQAVEIDGSHAMARCRRGISHYYRKNYRQAYQDLQRALALDPEIPNIKKYVQMAQKKLERGD